MNAVAFSLYGDVPKYTAGAIRNAELMPLVYPGWEMHLWYSETVPAAVTDRLHSLDRLRSVGIRLHAMDGSHPQKMFYRFLIHDEPGVERYLIRDCDSRISATEQACVAEWIAQGTVLHTIHDHPYHQSLIMGGLWGLWRAKTEIGSMADLIGAWSRVDAYGQDEAFLASEIWSRYQGSVTQHGKVLPIAHTEPGAFLGEILDEEDRPVTAHRKMRWP